MAKKLKSGKCVHCGCYSEEITSDHVFPESWYPRTTRENLYKWQVPSCSTCNLELGKIEKDLMIRIGLCLDPNDPSSRGIHDKARRAIDSKCGKGKKDVAARLAKRKQIMGQTMEGYDIPMPAVYPEFGPAEGHPMQEQIAVTLPVSSMRKLGEKIIRGIVYIEDGEIITDEHVINIFFTRDEGAKPLIEAVDKFGVELQREPGILIKKATVEGDLSSLFYIEIWKRLKLYGAVQPADT